MNCDDLPEGSRIGRFVLVHDVTGVKHAIASSAVAAACETEDGNTLLMLPGGRLVQLPQELEVVLGWLDGRQS